MSQQVGFNFQGDVFAGGSLAFSAAGRLLKALSDRNVDIYAVAAVVELGKRVPITQCQESIVSKSMEKRSNSRRGVLAKALSIGWGHNDVAYELSRTRAGCTALLLVDAFAAGTTSYDAADGLQHLMTLNGCDVGYLPTVDVIKGLVNHVVPIMEDSGFHAVLETVRATATIELRKAPDELGEHRDYALMSDRRRPREWADAAHQLILTAARGESIYLETVSRAAWLAAFAVHILDLGCIVLYQSRVLWAAAGDRGRVVMQIGPFPTQSSMKFDRVFALGFEPGAERLYRGKLEGTYFLMDALTTELRQLPQLSSHCHTKIKHNIIQLLCSSAISCRISDYGDVRITGSFGHVDQAILSVCRSLGIEVEHLEHEIHRCLQRAASGALPERLDTPLCEAVLQETQRACLCREHSEKYRDCYFRCLLRDVTSLVNGVAAAALALIPCHFDPSTTRVYASVLNGASQTVLRNTIFKGPISGINMNWLLSHLCHLLCGKKAERYSVPEDCLAVSLGGTTVAFKALLEEDAFSNNGQYLAIYSGRISFNEYIREFVIPDVEAVITRGVLPQSWSVAEGTYFKPYDARHLCSLEMDCNVRVLEDSFQILCAVHQASIERSICYYLGDQTESGEVISTFNINHAIKRLLETEIGQSCEHPKDSPFLVRDTEVLELRAGVFYILPFPRCCTFVSAQGNRLRQLISLNYVARAGGMFKTPPYLVLQGDLCLSCAYAVAIEEYGRCPEKYNGIAIICTQ